MWRYFVLFLLSLSTGLYAQNEVQKLEIKDGVRVSNFADSTIVIGSRIIHENYIDYMTWESVSWGLVRLYAKLSDYFSSAPYYHFDTVNVEHLMTHTSGYPAHIRIRDINDSIVQYHPSEKYIHSEVNIELLKKVLAVRLGSGFYTLFPEWIAKAGLEHTDFNTRNRTLLTTAEDLEMWLSKWLDKSLLKPDLMRYFFEAQVQADGRKYSYGWELLGDGVLLAFNEEEPQEFMAINVGTQHAIYAKNPAGFTRGECIAMIGKPVSSGKKMFLKLLPFLLLAVLAPVLYAVIKSRKRA